MKNGNCDATSSNENRAKMTRKTANAYQSRRAYRKRSDAAPCARVYPHLGFFLLLWSAGRRESLVSNHGCQGEDQSAHKKQVSGLRSSNWEICKRRVYRWGRQRARPRPQTSRGRSPPIAFHSWCVSCDGLSAARGESEGNRRALSIAQVRCVPVVSIIQLVPRRGRH